MFASSIKTSVRQALATEPRLPSRALATLIVFRLEPSTWEELGHELLVNYFQGLVRSEKARIKGRRHPTRRKDLDSSFRSYRRGSIWGPSGP